jgi:hypothetical protein
MLSDTDSVTIVVLKYYLYRAVGGPGFIAPIYVLYLLSNGLSYAEIGAIGAIQGVIVLAGEIPTGYVGDRIGRRNSLLVAQVLLTGSAVGMILASSFLAFTVSFGLLSFAMTFVSGSDDAWLYDILQEHLDEDRYTHVRGRGRPVGHGRDDDRREPPVRGRTHLPVRRRAGDARPDLPRRAHAPEDRAVRQRSQKRQRGGGE